MSQAKIRAAQIATLKAKYPQWAAKIDKHTAPILVQAEPLLEECGLLKSNIDKNTLNFIWNKAKDDEEYFIVHRLCINLGLTYRAW